MIWPLQAKHARHYTLEIKVDPAQQESARHKIVDFFGNSLCTIEDTFVGRIKFRIESIESLSSVGGRACKNFLVVTTPSLSFEPSCCYDALVALGVRVYQKPETMYTFDSTAMRVPSLL